MLPLGFRYLTLGKPLERRKTLHFSDSWNIGSQYNSLFWRLFKMRYMLIISNLRCNTAPNPSGPHTLGIATAILPSRVFIMYGSAGLETPINTPPKQSNRSKFMSTINKSLLTALAAACLTAAAAHATTTVSGLIWENFPSTVGAALAETPGTGTTLYGSLANVAIMQAARPTGDVTFTVPSNPLSMNSNGSTDYTISSFLGTGGGVINSLFNGALGTDTMNNTLWYITGTVTVTSGETFTAYHDDGLQLQIDGANVINVPNVTTPVTTTNTYSGPSGNESFSLAYAEVLGAPAVLTVSLPLVATLPDGGMTVGLLGFAFSGIACLGAFLRKFRA